MSDCFAGPAAAEEPPLRSQAGMPAMTNTSLLPFTRARGGASPLRIQLDLRPPENTKPTDAYTSAPGDKASTLRVPFAKPNSPAEALVSRVHREGLPVARLWENKSALLSLGLNQKGQPGLWLIQKTP
jgi:hypothetical protein